MHSLKIGDSVRWDMATEPKFGIVIEVVPPGQKPRMTGFRREAVDHETYVLAEGGLGAKKPNYCWRHHANIEPDDGLSAPEIAWCHATRDQVRKLMARQRNRRRAAEPSTK